MKDILSQGFAQMGLSVSPLAVDKLCRYAQLLQKQNQVMNLTAITEPRQVARLHFLDSAAVLAYGGPGDAPSVGGGAEGPKGALSVGFADSSPKGGAKGQELSQGGAAEGQELSQGGGEGSWMAGRRLIDVGTGAGFPGVVLKILEPSLSLTLVDSLGKRVTWLADVCKVLDLDGVQCLHARAEELAREEGFRDAFDLATSRAVASFPQLCELCLPFVRPGGVFWAMKSVESDGEIQAGATAVKRLGGRLLKGVDYPIPGTEILHRLVGVEKRSPTPPELPRAWGRIKKSPL